MKRSAKRLQRLTLDDLYWRTCHLFSFFAGKDYFKEKAGIDAGPYEARIPTGFQHKAAIILGFHAFPIDKWDAREISEDHIFAALELLDEHVSQPGEQGRFFTDEGDECYDYIGYDTPAGQAEFRAMLNTFLCNYKKGFRMGQDGKIQPLKARKNTC